MKSTGDSRGLTSEQVASQRELFGENSLPGHSKSTIWQQVLSVVRQPMLLLLLSAGAINFALSEPLDGFMLLFFVLVVVGISIYQEHKSENALEALRDLAAPNSRVIRDGKELVVPSSELVVGDLVLLSEGDRVPADIRLLGVSNFAVDESALTGESIPIDKFANNGDEQILAGTLVVRGRGKGLVTATGLRTDLGKIGQALSSLQNEATPLQREVSRLILVVALIASAAAALVALGYGLTRGDWLTALLAGIATAMAMLPEEFPVVLTIFMALGAWRMSRLNVLARRPQVIETLGSASVICVDKTGTLTTNQMVVAGFYGGDVAKLKIAASLASAEDPTDPMDKAFRLEQPKPHDWVLVREYPLTQELLAVTNVWQKGDGSIVVAAKGAPEAIARICNRETPSELDRYATKGERVLAIATCEFAGELPETAQGFKLQFLGLAGLKDPVRAGVRESLAECYSAGIRTIMITGDHPLTALAIAAELKLEAAAGSLTGTEVDALSDDELVEKLKTVNVFARMVPEQKLRIVNALKAQGHVVAMTGDGVNDAPALKAADIGIAMGLRGTDVAREAADLILTDDDFSSIERGIKQGRGIFNNLRKAMSYIVAVHIPLLGVALLPVFFEAWPLVLLPVLIAVIELIIDPACSVVFESEQVDPRVMQQKPRAMAEKVFTSRALGVAIAQGLISFAAVISVYFWAIASHHSEAEVRSLTFIALVASNALLILTNRSWHLSIFESLRTRKNATLKWLFLGVASAMSIIFGWPAAREAFNLGEVTAFEAVAACLIALAGVSWFEVYKRVRR